MGLRTREEIPRAPIRMPISTSVEPDLERYIGMVGTKMWKTEVNANCAKKQRMNSRDNIFLAVIWDLVVVIPIVDGFYTWRIFSGDLISESFSDDLKPFLPRPLGLSSGRRQDPALKGERLLPS
jgi:hypothetical protein